MSFSHKYNTDNSIIRACIVGLVNELNNRIYFENVWEDDRKELVRVPFFYAMSGDERFLQDYFSNWSDCAPDFIEGNTDPIPRGTIFLTGVSVLGGQLTSRYVRGYYTKEQEGELRRFNSYVNSIPLQMTFTAEILADTSIDTFKIAQSAISVLYRTLVYSVNFEGFRVPVQAGFPENYNIAKQFEFTYGNTDVGVARLKVSFDVEVQGYLPLVDPGQVFSAGQALRGFVNNSGTEADGFIPVQLDITPPTGATMSTQESNIIYPSTGNQNNQIVDAGNGGNISAGAGGGAGGGVSSSISGNGNEGSSFNTDSQGGGIDWDYMRRYRGDYWE